MINVGLLGCGVALEHHLRALKIMEHVNILWFCDIERSKAELARRSWGRGGAVGAHIDDLLEKSKPDVVHICTPPATHAELAVKILNAGCNVLLEKPMATSIEGAERIIEARDAGRRSLCVMHNHIFDPTVIAVDRAIKKGALGELIYGKVIYFVDWKKMVRENLNRKDHWAFSLTSGVAGEYIPHPIYLIQHYLGTCLEIQVMYASEKLRGPETVPRESFAVQMRFEGSLGSIFLIDCLPYGHFSIDLHGTLAAAHINMMDLTFSIERIRSGLPLPAAQMASTVEQSFQKLCRTFSNTVNIMTGRLRRRPGHKHIIQSFYQSIRDGGAPPISGEEGLETVRTIHQLDQAMAKTKNLVP